MITDTDVLAARLVQAAADLSPVASFSGELAGFDAPAGYAVQAVSREKAGPLAGWKIGLTTRAEQARTGVGEPVRGFLARDRALDLGAPVVTGDLIRPLAEPQIVFTMGADLSGSDVTAADVLAATRGVSAGIEILDSRFLDSASTVPDLIADNASAGRYLAGAPVPPGGIDLRLVGVVLEHNGRVTATASGAASLGHPAAAVAWLTRSLAAAGESLQAGQIVFSGGLTVGVPLRPGDVVVASIDRLGTIELACR
jgi:2-oxo-3-hexenedioate decarboxylase